MKNLFKIFAILTPLFIVGAFVAPQMAVAEASQIITLQPGWNIISTPRVLASHQFSADEISDNFDIYLLDPASPSGWQTMQGAGQSEFQPLFAYFINNKTGQAQTLTLIYNFDLTPAQRLFQRTLQPGWNAIGIASPSYALPQGSTSADINNPSNILSSISGSVGQVVDFTNSNANLDSPSISGTWLSKTAADVNSLNDFRELKGYGVFITSATNNYIGSQNLSLTTQYTLNYVAGANGSITGTETQIVVEGQNGTAVTAVADAGYRFVDWSDGSTDNPRTDTSVSADISVTANFEAISAGTLTVTKMTDSPSGNIINGNNNVVLAKYELVASGERIKIQSLRVSAAVSNLNVSQLRNGALYANGVQIGSTTDIEVAGDAIDATNEYATYNLGSSLIVDPGSPVTLEVKADIYDNDGTNDFGNGDTISVKLAGGDLDNAYGMTSLLTVDVPASDVLANTITVSVGGLSLSKYVAYTNQTVVPPLAAFKLAHFTLSASEAEDVNINTIEVDLNSIVAVTSNLYVRYGTNTTTTVNTSSSTKTWSVNYTLSAGQTIDVMVYGDISSEASEITSSSASVQISGTTASSATSVSTALLEGQNIEFTTGSITSAVDGSTPIASAVAGNQNVTAGKFKFTATNDSYTIQETKFTINDNNGDVISSASLRDGSTVLATVAYDSTNNWFNFTGMNIAIPSNTTKVLTLTLSLAVPSADNSTTGVNVKSSLAFFKAMNSQGVVSTDSTVRTANDLYVYKSIPTFTVGSVSGQGTNLSAGASTSLYKFNVAADAQGEIALKQLKFNLTVNDVNTPAASLSSFKLFRGSTDISTAVTIQTISGVSLMDTTSMSSGEIFVTFNNEEVIPAGTTYAYTLKALPSGFSVNTSGGDSVTTGLLGDSSSSADSGLYYLSAASNSGVQTLYTAANHGGSDAAENTIWSDNSATAHSYEYNSSSADWFNGYLINSLPLDVIGIAAQ